MPVAPTLHVSDPTPAARLNTPRIAVCEAGPLTPDRDAGARAVADLMQSAQTLGATVAYLDESEGDMLARLRAYAPTAIVISRPGLFRRLQPHLNDLTVPIIYFAHDVHHVRLELQRQFDDTLSARAVRVMKLIEEYCFREADLTVMPTRKEADFVRESFSGVAVTWMRYFALPARPAHPLSRALREERRADVERRLVFVGGSNHAPNRDGVTWFVEEVWPTLQEHEANLRLDICGAWDQELVASLERSGITFHGPVSEAALDAIMDSASAGIAPLRFGAGMKRKTLDYLSRGLPVISTIYGIEGLSIGTRALEPIPGVLVCQTPGEWLSAVTHLLNDDDDWDLLSAQGQRFSLEEFSSQAHKMDLRRILTDVGVPL
jgi:glycosyltransferase involved in cell wall biosynthesis